MAGWGCGPEEAPKGGGETWALARVQWGGSETGAKGSREQGQQAGLRLEGRQMECGSSCCGPYMSVCEEMWYKLRQAEVGLEMSPKGREIKPRKYHFSVTA